MKSPLTKNTLGMNLDPGISITHVTFLSVLTNIRKALQAFSVDVIPILYASEQAHITSSLIMSSLITRSLHL